MVKERERQSEKRLSTGHMLASRLYNEQSPSSISQASAGCSFLALSLNLKDSDVKLSVIIDCSSVFTILIRSREHCLIYLSQGFSKAQKCLVLTFQLLFLVKTKIPVLGVADLALFILLISISSLLHLFYSAPNILLRVFSFSLY